MLDELSATCIFHQRCVSKSLASDNQFGEKCLMDCEKRAADLLLNEGIKSIPGANGARDYWVYDSFFRLSGARGI